MSSSKSLFAAALMLALVLATASCGFKPMYGEGRKSAAAADYKNISIDNIPDRDGQYLRNMLLDRLAADAGGGSAYTLKVVDLKKTVTDASLRKDATYTRGEMEIDATLELIDNSTGQIVLKRPLRSVGSYNLLDNQFATIVSEQTVTENALNEMSDSIVTEISLYFTRKADQP